MWFDKVIGQKELIGRLKRMVDTNTLPHALLLAGEEGYGSLPLALGLAQYANCSNLFYTNACDECPSCIQMGKLQHPDVHFSFPILRTSDTQTCLNFKDLFVESIIENPYISIDEWAEKLGKKNSRPTIYTNEADDHIEKIAMVTAVQSRFKVFIIWQPETMQATCANRLLKTIEEPVGETLFILVSAQPEKILGTIVSRCQRINVNPIAETDLLDNIKEQFEQLSEERCTEIAHNALGNWQNVVTEVKGSEIMDNRLNLFANMMRASVSFNVDMIANTSKAYSELSRQECIFTLQYGQHMIRENFFLRLGVSNIQYLSAKERAFSLKFNPFIHENNAEEIMEELALAERQIAQNANISLVIFDLCTLLYFLLKRDRPKA